MFQTIKLNCKKAIVPLQTIVATMLWQTQIAAMDIQSYTINGSLDITQSLGKVIGLLVFIFRLVGVASLIYGIYQILQTLNESNPNQRNAGIVASAAGLILAGLPSLLGAMGIINV